jgi:hypothetical protein
MANTVGAKPKSYEDYVNNSELTDKQEEFVKWLGKIGVDLDAYDEEAMDAFRRGLYLAWALRSRFQEHNRSVKVDESDEVPLPKKKAPKAKVKAEPEPEPEEETAPEEPETEEEPEEVPAPAPKKKARAVKVSPKKPAAKKVAAKKAVPKVVEPEDDSDEEEEVPF